MTMVMMMMRTTTTPPTVKPSTQQFLIDQFNPLCLHNHADLDDKGRVLKKVRKMKYFLQQ